ncbi:MAG: ABC transporter permease [Williamsia sp.]|nr:ABC transporter permease [Williamsia sp.]
MFRNYLKIAFRNLLKSKGYSAINITGLAVGLATGLVILLFVLDETNYDRYNQKADRIYRVDGDIRFGGDHYILAVAPDAMGSALLKDYPQIEQAVRFRNYGGMRVKKGDEWIQEDRVISTDSTLFDVFTLPLIEGNARTALANPHTVVITEQVAKKYFNSTAVLGKVLQVNDAVNYTITGVIRNIPSGSHFNFDFFLPLADASESRENNWVSNNFNTYIVLKEGADPKALEAQLDLLAERYIGPQVKSAMNINMDDFKKSGNWVRYSLTPLTRIHLYSDKTAELAPNGSVQYVYIFSAIAGFILLIACVNFMNLSTARSANRAREVGIRKVLGSRRLQLVYQFLAESFLITCISLLLALGLVLLLLPLFNQVSGKELRVASLGKQGFLTLMIPLVLVVGFVAGSYPALFLSSFRPVSILKGKLATGLKGGWLRSGLVVFQFTITVVLLVATVVVQSQLNFIRNKQIGFNRAQVLVVQHTNALSRQAAIHFREDLLNISGVQAATLTGYLPTSGSRSDSPLFPDATLNQKRAVSMQTWNIDEYYIPTLGMHMSKGRNFSSGFPTDSSAVIINEAAAKLLGFDDPLNKPLYQMNSFTKKDVSAYTIIGVVKDFNFNSIRQRVTPLALFLRPSRGSLALRIQSANLTSLIGQVRQQWKALLPNQPFDYTFMDDDFNRIYQSEHRVGRIALSFSALAIFIACLGLFGLVTYAAEQRTREIGIRKVLGASVSSIVNMLSKDFLKLVVLSLFVAFPLAWWGMNKWLEDFAYRISIGWWIFAAAGLTALLIALLTVSFQAIKAALMNPVKSLRTE